MEDLSDVQTRYMDRIFAANKELQAPDLIARAIYAITRSTFCVMDGFYLARFNDEKLRKKDLLKHVKAAVEWTTTIFYLEEIELPEMDAIVEAADEFDIEIAADGILAALHVQRSLGDYGLDYFCSDTDEAPTEEVSEYLIEVLACLELLARRLDSSIAELI